MWLVRYTRKMTKTHFSLLLATLSLTITGLSQNKVESLNTPANGILVTSEVLKIN